MLTALEPLLNDGPAIAIHAIAAFAALGLGLGQLVLPKGTISHRIIGYGWAALMLIIALSSFFIRGLDHFYGFSVIHILSIAVLINLPLAIIAARRGKIDTHRNHMRGLYLYGLVLAGALTLFPGRRMYSLVFGG